MRNPKFAARCAAALALGALAGCASMKTAGKAAATPLTVARDAVDAPVASVANVFEFFARQTRPAKAPSAGIGVGLGGVSPFVGYDMSFFVFKGVSWIVGGADYVVCRSVWPNHPRGLSPWLKKGQSWGDLYFVNTRALWGEAPKGYAAKEEGEKEKE